MTILNVQKEIDDFKRKEKTIRNIINVMTENPEVRDYVNKNFGVDFPELNGIATSLEMIASKMQDKLNNTEIDM